MSEVQSYCLAQVRVSIKNPEHLYDVRAYHYSE